MTSAEINVSNLDLYELLDLLPDATEQAIKKAYRKKALKCHPDKNPDNPQAAVEWEKLAKALEILTDPEAKAAYDKVLKARKAAELRNRALESKRKKIKEDLESREASFRQEQGNTIDAACQLEREILRLREEGSRTLKKEQELLKTELLQASAASEEESPKLKVKWKSKKEDAQNGGYSYEFLKRAFDKYGKVTNIIISSKRNGSAIVEFSTVHAAELAVSNEVGLQHNPLVLTWLSGKPETTRPPVSKPSVQVEDGGDFESAVLRKLMEAEQRKQERHADELDKDMGDGRSSASSVEQNRAGFANFCQREDDDLLGK
ncbi:dnaJ homolog subfamily C member 17-like [Diadema antillarum]|uniref:dnaJ homolog subfamily C member 17-like n=1 Tax=Diadema antillarum TaxID=105358 RepID=UPI003A864720